MADCDIVFGNLKRERDPDIKSLLTWQENPSTARPKREKSGKWLSETQHAYQYHKEPPSENIQKSLVDLVPTNLQEPPVQNLEPEILAKKPEAKKYKEKNPLEPSRNLSDSAFSSKYKKPVFAQYGQGNISQPNKMLFSKSHMKTHNVLLFKTSKDKKSVENTAKVQALLLETKKELKKTQMVKKDIPQTESAGEYKQENAEKNENPENKEVAEGSRNEGTIDFSTQVQSKPGENVCKNCQCLYQYDKEEEFTKKYMTMPAERNPQNYKNLPVSFTKNIPIAGRCPKKSESAYTVIFG
ncbi:hypothetical protein SteCoe_1135 [Stentor coeruleus]|uniref:Uncharacterized protein n=1 Tax=Stentor coeruleus TaxID=5963 RepID=A0A1R2D2Q9_9CILI|nr:hypothetical protein SteCoe_1135 [Stentor coeruleus]